MSVSKLKERAQRHKLICEEKIKELNLQPNYNYMIGTENATTFYTISRSLYKTGKIQLTNFIRNEPYSHITYDNIQELINDFNKAFFTDKKELYIMEVIPYE